MRASHWETYSTRCPKKKSNRSGDQYIGKRDDNKKDYKDKGNKSCYIIEEESNDGFDDHDDEVVYVSMKDELENEDWNQVMSEEIDEIKRNKTWTFLPSLENKNVIGTK